MHALRLQKSILQGGSNRLCSYKARSHVDNDSVKKKFPTAYAASISCFKIGLDRCEEVERPLLVVVSIHVELFR